MEALVSFIMPAIVLVRIEYLRPRAVALGLRHRKTLFGAGGGRDWWVEFMGSGRENKGFE